MSVYTRLNRILSLQMLLAVGSTLCLSAGAAELNQQEQNDKESAKNSNVAVAKQLNGDPEAAAKKSDNKNNDKLGGASALSDSKNKADAKNTANVVNQIPGVKVSQKDLQPPADQPIKGFHPIKKLLRPVENLEGMSIKLEQQIMKLEGPIAALQPPMLSLQHKMTSVNEQMGSMQTQINQVQTQMGGVRSDIAAMRKDIESLREPIVGLKGPIGTVAKPLETLQTQLNFILGAILVAALAIAIGTPLAAIMIYKNRHRLFKNEDMPKVDVKPDPAAASSRR